MRPGGGSSSETFVTRTSVAGVKRKGLASELLAARADSYHTSWVSAWDTLMPSELMTKVGV